MMKMMTIMLALVVMTCSTNAYQEDSRDITWSEVWSGAKDNLHRYLVKQKLQARGVKNNGNVALLNGAAWACDKGSEAVAWGAGNVYVGVEAVNNVGKSAFNRVAKRTTLCVSDVRKQQATVVKSIFVHDLRLGGTLVEEAMPHISRDIINEIHSRNISLCDTWDHVRNVTRFKISEYKSVPKYDSPKEMADTFDMKYPTNANMQDQKGLDCQGRVLYC